MKYFLCVLLSMGALICAAQEEPKAQEPSKSEEVKKAEEVKKSSKKLDYRNDFKKNVKKHENGDVMIEGILYPEDIKDKYTVVPISFSGILSYFDSSLDLVDLDKDLQKNKRPVDSAFEEYAKKKLPFELKKLSSLSESNLKSRINLGLPVLMRAKWSPEFQIFLRERSKEREEAYVEDWKNIVGKKEFKDLRKIKSGDGKNFLPIIGYSEKTKEYCLMAPSRNIWITYSELKTLCENVYEFKGK